MRANLEQLNGHRLTFRATFDRFGQKTGWKGRILTTLLFKNITDQYGKEMCDHLWFNLTEAFDGLNLKPGDKVEFTARIEPYTKGYRGRREDAWSTFSIDYRLSRPTNVRRLDDHVQKPLLEV